MGLLPCAFHPLSKAVNIFSESADNCGFRYLMVQSISPESLVPGISRSNTRPTLEQVGRAPPKPPATQQETSNLSGLGVAYDLLFGSPQNNTLAVGNANRGLSFVQTASNALNETISALNELRGIAVRATSDEVTDDEREDLQEKADELIQRVNEIAETTTFEGKKIFDGSLESINFAAGGNQNDLVSLVALKADAIGLGLQQGSLLTQGDRAALEEDEEGTGGIQEGNATVDDIRSLVIKLEDESLQQRLDIAATEFGGPIAVVRNTADLTDPLNDNYGAGIARSAAERINAIRESGGNLQSLFADAETRFTGADVADGDFSGQVAENEATTIAAGSLARGDLVINGVKVGATAFQAGDASGTLAFEINRQQRTTGVTAAVTDTGELQLTAEDGRDLVISTRSADVTNRLFGGGGERFSEAFDKLRISGRVSLYSESDIRVLGADAATLGLNATDSDGTVPNERADANLAAFAVSDTGQAEAAAASVDAAFRQIRNFSVSLNQAAERFREGLDSVSAGQGGGDISGVIASLSRQSFREQASTAVAAQANADPDRTLFFLRS